MKKILFLVAILCIASIFKLATSFAVVNTVQFTGINNFSYTNPITKNTQLITNPTNNANLSISNSAALDSSYNISQNMISFSALDSNSNTPVSWLTNKLKTDENIDFSGKNVISQANITPKNLYYALTGNLSFKKDGSNYFCKEIFVASGNVNGKTYSWFVANLDRNNLTDNLKIDGAVTIQCNNTSTNSVTPSYFSVKATGSNTFDVQPMGDPHTICFNNIVIDNFTNSKVTAASGRNFQNSVSITTTGKGYCLTANVDYKSGDDVSSTAQNYLVQNGVNYQIQNMASVITNGKTPKNLGFLLTGDMTFHFNDSSLEYNCKSLAFGKGMPKDGGSSNAAWWGFGNTNLSSNISTDGYQIKCNDNSGNLVYLYPYVTNLASDSTGGTFSISSTPISSGGYIGKQPV